jgi:HTH-type transcriptional regulator/antitoxin MqsA
MKRRKDEIRLPRCPDCGHEQLERRRTTHRWVEGVDEKREYLAEIDVVACPSCGCEVIDEYARRQKHEVWCRANRLLAPSEIRGLRKRLGLSTEQFADLIGAGPASISRWERGVIVQNGTNDRLMRLLASDENVRALAVLSGVSVPRVTGGATTRVVQPDGSHGEWKIQLSASYRPDDKTLLRQEAFLRTTYGHRLDVA